MITISFIWWHAILAIVAALYIAISLYVGVKAGWKIGVLWPMFLLLGGVHVQ